MKIFSRLVMLILDEICKFKLIDFTSQHCQTCSFFLLNQFQNELKMRLLITALEKMQISPPTRAPLKGGEERNEDDQKLELGAWRRLRELLLFFYSFSSIQESMMLFQKVKKRLSKASLLTHLARKSLCIWLRKGSHQLKHVQPHHILVCQYS